MLKEEFQEKIVPKLKDKIGKGNSYGVPTVTKIVVNTGVGASRDNKEELEKAREELAKILGQAPAFRSARRAVASFGIRGGDVVGAIAQGRAECQSARHHA